MVAPNFKKAASTVPGTSAKYGAPDLKYITDVLDGTHSTDRLQISNIEGAADRLALFDWLIKSSGTPGGQDYLIQAINLKTGKVQFSNSDMRPVWQAVMDTLPSTAPGESVPVLKIALNGILDCTVRGFHINRSVVVDGLGTATIRRATAFEFDSATVVNINASNVVIRNLTVEDIVMHTDDYPNTTKSKSVGIGCRPLEPGVEHLVFENVHIKNFVHHCFVLSANVPRYIKDVTLRRCTVNSLRGSSITIRLGTTNCNVEYCTVLNSNHSGIDLSGVNPPIKMIGNRIHKTIGTGPGIAMVTYAERLTDKGEAEEIIIRDNWIFTNEAQSQTQGITQEGILIHGEANNIVVENNYVEGVGRYGIQVSAFNVFLDTEEPVEKYSREVIIAGNVIKKSFAPGINVTSEPDWDYPAIAIIGNNIQDTKGNTAISLNSDANSTLIANNQIYKTNSRQLADGSGIKMRSGSSDCLVINNQLFLDGNATYSIWEDGTTSGRSLIRNNLLVTGDGGSSKPISVEGATSVISQNVGFRTENSGTATIATGSQSVAVTHGLGYTPALRDILVRPTNDMGDATKWWVSSPTSAQFTINVNVNPSSSTATFAWKAVRRR